MQGFAAGIMIAAFGLYYNLPLIMVQMVIYLLGYLLRFFILGGVFIRGLDAVIPHIPKIGDKSQYRRR